MACFLKLPNLHEKGVVVFTSIEYSYYISKSHYLYNSLMKCHKNWIIGYHHNSPYSDLEFSPDSLFDFYIAGKGDIWSPENKSFFQIEMDCSNFCPDIFEDKRRIKTKFWDVLSISRNVDFKSLNDLLLIIRKIFDSKLHRVLAIIPHENLHKKGVGPSEIIKNYLKMFSDEERKHFTILTPSLDYPFPFDQQTLAFFYHNSKTYLHAAQNERHSRVAAYAWIAGIPVIGRKGVGSLLPDKLKKPPGFWEYENLDQAVKYTLESLSENKYVSIFDLYGSLFLGKNTIPNLKYQLKKLYGFLNTPYSDKGWILNNLDIRLARHHTGNFDRNSIPMTLLQLSYILGTEFYGSNILPVSDFEMELSHRYKNKNSLQDKLVGLEILISN